MIKLKLLVLGVLIYYILRSFYGLLNPDLSRLLGQFQFYLTDKGTRRRRETKVCLLIED